MSTQKLKAAREAYGSGKRKKAFRILEKATECNSDAMVVFVLKQAWASNQHRHEFWKSRLANILVPEFVNCESSIVIIEAYFSQNSPYWYSELVTQTFFNAAPEVTIKAIRMSKSYLNDALWSQLQKCSEPMKSLPERLRKAFGGFERVRKMVADARHKRNGLNGRLKSYGIVELLTLIAIFLEKRRLVVKYVEKSNFESKELFYLAVISRLLKIQCRRFT